MNFGKTLFAQFMEFVPCNTNEARDWLIWRDLATLLIRRARKPYCNDNFGVDLT